jgi:chromate transport protein ChrA
MTSIDTDGVPAAPDVRDSRQLLAWATIVMSIGAWTVHIVGLAALVQYVCDHPGVEWVMHGMTVGLALVTLLLTLLCVPGARLPDGDEEAGTATASVRFLSRVAIAIGSVNLLLIVVEGVYVVFLDPCTRS